MSLNVIPEIMTLTKDEIALIVKKARLQRPFTQKELAGLAGVTLRSLQRIENGEVLPRAYTLSRLATHIDLSSPLMSNNPIAASHARPNIARRWILTVSSLVGLILTFGAYIIQSPTFPETLFETLLTLLAGCLIYTIILYRIWL